MSEIGIPNSLNGVPLSERSRALLFSNVGHLQRGGEMYVKAPQYGPGGQHPILRPSNSPWLVIDSVGYNWRELDEVPWARKGDAMAMDILFNGDDPTHEFLPESEWAPFPNAKKLAAAYNRPFERNFVLRIRRATESASVAQVILPHYEAEAALELARSIRGAPEDAHLAQGYDFLEYYPDGLVVRGPQVWRNGQFWMRLPIN